MRATTGREALSCAMPVCRVALGLAFAYVVLALLAWLFQDRLAFPAPRGAVPQRQLDPLSIWDAQPFVVPNGERIELTLGNGTRLAGWYLRALGVEPGAVSPGLL